MQCICAGCPRPLSVDRRRQRNPIRYCSRTCRGRAIRGVRVEARRCLHCNRPFESASRIKRHCSSRCRDVARLALLASRTTWREGECESCGASYRTKQPAQKYCGRSCNEYERRQRRGYNSRRRVSKPVRQRILARDNWTCYLCQRPISRDLLWPHPRSASVDHVIPVSAGGSDDPSNLRATHWHCNEEKGDRLPGVEVWVPAEAA